MKLYIGSSGFGYKQWIGDFYAKDASRDMLGFYGKRFNAVEINNTFYRLPDKETLLSWAAQTPEEFKFSLKAPRALTHIRRLKNADDIVNIFLQRAAVLGDRLGPILFQLPPYLKLDFARLKDFLKLLDPKIPAAFEFRHPSWFTDEVFYALHTHSCALCWADAGKTADNFVSTSDWGYLRLRQSNYKRDELSKWLETIEKQDWHGAYIFFKHDKSATSPVQAEQFLEVAIFSLKPQCIHRIKPRSLDRRIEAEHEADSAGNADR